MFIKLRKMLCCYKVRCTTVYHIFNVECLFLFVCYKYSMKKGIRKFYLIFNSDLINIYT